jgi:hypothetical protein
MSGPCLCGDPWCERCFPRAPVEPDPDDLYDRMVQDELDSNRGEEPPKEPT